jgi:hypothetical protein
MTFATSLVIAVLAWAMFSSIVVNRRFSTWSLDYRIVAIGASVGLAILALILGNPCAAGHR